MAIFVFQTIRSQTIRIGHLTNPTIDTAGTVDDDPPQFVDIRQTGTHGFAVVCGFLPIHGVF
jgi:hypothetical protein